MAAKTVTFDRVVILNVVLTKDSGNPVRPQITYELSSSTGEYPTVRSFVPNNIPNNVQTQLDALWALAAAATNQREGL